jgi:Flp pilus assembly protein TadD
VDAGNPEAAEAVLDAAGVDEEEFAYVARERGRALARSGRFAEAESPLRTAVRTDPWDPETHEALARVYGATGRADLAEREQRLAGAWR